MPRAGFEPVTPATKRPQTYALHRAATGIGTSSFTTMCCLRFEKGTSQMCHMKADHCITKRR
jgi:hypothetical protein